MSNYDLRYYQQNAGDKGGSGIRAARAQTAAINSENAHFIIAQAAAEEKRIKEKERENELQKGYSDKEITDSFFIKSNGVSAFPSDSYQTILNIMCVNATDGDKDSRSNAQIIIEKKLEFPLKHKDIQILENLGIKKFYLNAFITSCELDLELMDLEPMDIVIFMLKNAFFSKEEILENLSLLDPIPFYNPDVVVDQENNVAGFSVKTKSKLMNIPDNIQAMGTDAMRIYVEERFNRLKTAVREDYFKRMKKLEVENTRSLSLKPKEE